MSSPLLTDAAALEAKAAGLEAQARGLLDEAQTLRRQGRKLRVEADGSPPPTATYSLTLGLPAAPAAWVDERPAEWKAVRAFVRLMVIELAANSGKGDRAAWIKMSPETALSELHHHVAKLHVCAVEAKRRNEGATYRPLPWGDSADFGVREFGADVANCSLHLLDVFGLLGLGTEF